MGFGDAEVAIGASLVDVAGLCMVGGGSISSTSEPSLIILCSTLSPSMTLFLALGVCQFSTIRPQVCVLTIGLKNSLIVCPFLFATFDSLHRLVRESPMYFFVRLFYALSFANDRYHLALSF